MTKLFFFFIKLKKCDQTKNKNCDKTQNKNCDQTEKKIKKTKKKL